MQPVAGFARSKHSIKDRLRSGEPRREALAVDARAAKLREIFESVDTNGDGSINKREMIKFCRTSPDVAVLLGFPEGVRQEDGSRDVLERRFQAMDRDDDREVTWAEFLDFFMQEAQGPARGAQGASGGAGAPSPEVQPRLGLGDMPGPPISVPSAAMSVPISAPMASPARPAPSPAAAAPRDDFESQFEQQHRAWLESQATARRAEEAAESASLRAAERLLGGLAENPFELIPLASELPAMSKDVARTLHALHKESARNLERLKFHVRQLEDEQEQLGQGLADSRPPEARPATQRMSTPDVQRQGLKAPWAMPKPNEATPSRLPGAWPVGRETLTGRKRGRDWVNQDSEVVVPLSDSRILLGVFDGHGEQGHEISSSVAQLFSHFEDPSDASPQHFARLFALAQDGLRRGGLAEWSGTTATVALVDAEAGSVVCAYVGDSRMIICHEGKVLFATTDHDVDAEAEARINSAGGEVRRMWVSGIDARRVFLKGCDVPGLSMSRALGDLQASAVGVLNEPCIHTCVQIPAGSALIMASDGLWEKVTSEEAAAILAATLKLEGPPGPQGVLAAARALVAEARSRWVKEGGDVDDITALALQL